MFEEELQEAESIFAYNGVTDYFTCMNCGHKVTKSQCQNGRPTPKNRPSNAQLAK